MEHIINNNKKKKKYQSITELRKYQYADISKEIREEERRLQLARKYDHLIR